MSPLASATQAPHRHWQQDPQDRERQRRMGLKVLLIVISSLFFLFFIAFISRSQFGDWLALADPNGPILASGQLWLNTLMLVLGSGALEWAHWNARCGQQKAKLGVALGGLFACLFLFGQWLVWQQLLSWGYLASTNPALGFFYLLTGMHGLHLAGGVIAWLMLAYRTAHTRDVSTIAIGIRLCATYWHYLLGLWLLLFALVTSTPETYRAIAEFCGLGY